MGLGWLTGGASLWQLSFCKGHTFTHKKAHVCLRLHIKGLRLVSSETPSSKSTRSMCSRYSYLSRGTKVKNGATPLFQLPITYCVSTPLCIYDNTSHNTHHRPHLSLSSLIRCLCCNLGFSKRWFTGKMVSITLILALFRS